MKIFLVLGALLVSLNAGAVYIGGNFRNDSAINVWLKVMATNTLRDTWTAMGQVNAGTTANLGDWSNAGGTLPTTGLFRVYSDSGYTTLLVEGSGALTTYSGGYPVVYTYSGGVTPTYYWCVYYITWTNRSSKWAQFEYYLQDAGGTWYAPTNMQARMVAPGNYVTPFYVTNSLGTNNIACPRMWYGDMRPGQEAPLTDGGNGTKYNQLGSGQGSGGGDGKINQGPDPNRADPGSTNGATSADIRYLGDLIGYLDYDLRSADAAARSNGWLKLISGELFRTNTYGQLWGVLTNLADIRTNLAGLGGGPSWTNFSSNVVASASSSPTWETASNNAASQFNYAEAGAIDTIAAGFGSGHSLGPGASSALSFSFCGSTLSADPETQWPGLMGWIKTLTTLVLLVGFAYSVGTLLWEAARAFSSAQGGGVPNLNASILGTGGNVIGIVVALAVPLAMVILWKVVWGLFLGNAITQYLNADVTTFGFGNFTGSQAALYLLDQSFPITLFFSLVCCRLSMHFLAAKVVMLASAASRWLWTK